MTTGIAVALKTELASRHDRMYMMVEATDFYNDLKVLLVLDH